MLAQVLAMGLCVTVYVCPSRARQYCIETDAWIELYVFLRAGFSRRTIHCVFRKLGYF